MSYIIYNENCLDAMKRLEDNSVDSIVTDPPYGLSFMGKKWDYDVPSTEIWAECLRVLKPGGHLLAFAGTRTQHRMAVRIEDAGFEIRDMIAWVYGSGFPKSMDVSKAIDKNNGEVGRLHKFTEWMRTTGLSAKQINDATDTFMGSHYLTDKSQPAIPTRALWSKLRPLCGFIPAWVDELVDRIEAEREVVGQKIINGEEGTAGGYKNGIASIQGADISINRSIDITIAATPEAKQWEGWGTALKPALEPITVARKPLIGTVAENVLQHGTGAINVDGCRVGTDGGCAGAGAGARVYGDGLNGPFGKPVPGTGRWPANLILDGSDEVLAGFPESNSAIRNPTGRQLYAGNALNSTVTQDTTVRGFSDKGSAARFFYCAKASKKDRDEGLEGFEAKATAFGNQAQAELKRGNLEHDDGNSGMNKVKMRQNIHPTVKPTDLMRYLCRLVTPTGGVVLDPFMGSGSTGKAAMLEGFSFIGCELSEEYASIANARIEAAMQKETTAFLESINRDLFA
jgi:DNA modification methylase